MPFSWLQSSRSAHAASVVVVSRDVRAVVDGRRHTAGHLHWCVPNSRAIDIDFRAVGDSIGCDGLPRGSPPVLDMHGCRYKKNPQKVFKNTRAQFHYSSFVYTECSIHHRFARRALRRRQNDPALQQCVLSSSSSSSSPSLRTRSFHHFLIKFRHG